MILGGYTKVACYFDFPDAFVLEVPATIALHSASVTY